jgi:hypothetical protein
VRWELPLVGAVFPVMLLVLISSQDCSKTM